MASNDIPLTTGIRGNLLLLQSTQSLLDRTQQRLSTGNKINSALDGPVAYFAAKGLNTRADDLSSLKDSIGQSVSTIHRPRRGRGEWRVVAHGDDRLLGLLNHRLEHEFEIFQRQAG